MSGSIGNNARSQGHPQPRIFEEYIEGVVDGRSFTLAESRRLKCFRLAKQQQRTVNQVRPKIPKNPGGWEIGVLSPSSMLSIESIAIESGFVFDHFAKFSRLDQFLDREERAVPAAVLIYGQKPASLEGQADEFFCFHHGGGHRLVHDYIAIGFQARSRIS